jgi:hypothetical protein
MSTLPPDNESYHAEAAARHVPTSWDWQEIPDSPFVVATEIAIVGSFPSQ